MTQALISAAQQGQYYNVFYMMARGGDPAGRDSQLNSPLHYASINTKSKALMALLLEYGADVNAKYVVIALFIHLIRNSNDETPLLWAASRGEYDNMVFLVCIRDGDGEYDDRLIMEHRSRV